MKILFDYMKKHRFIYFFICLMFVIGMVVGFVWLIKFSDVEEIKCYIKEVITVTNKNGIDKLLVFKNSIIENIKFIFILYLLGCTIIAGFTVYIAVIYKGFLIGYTISSILITFDFTQSLKYLFPTVILHNVVFLPIVFLLALSGIILYKEIMKKNYNLKTGLIRHSIILLISLVFCVISSGIEAYLSTIIFEIL